MTTTATTTAEAGPSTIPLYLINGVATIWDAQTAATLHCQHDISGLRVGTLPGVSQQNGFLGLPMTLMQEETAHLVNSGICHLVPISSRPILPSPDQIEYQKTLRIARIQNLERIAKEEAERNAVAAKEMFAKGGDKAKAKREERAKAKAEAAKSKNSGSASAEGDNLFTPDQSSSIPVLKKVEPKSTQTQMTTKQQSPTSTSASTPTPSLGYFHTVPSLPPILPTTTSSSCSSTPTPQFPYPKTSRQKANLHTFQTLSALSYRMGLGPRFGGEYLIYPGDYLRYHAHFTSQVVKGDEPIKPMEIVAWGRLGTGTKKAGLICCVSSKRSERERERSERESGQCSELDGTSGMRAELDMKSDGRGEQFDKLRAGEDRESDQEGLEEEEKGGVEFYSLEWANFG